MRRLLSQSGNATVLAFYEHVRCPSPTGEWFEPRSHFISSLNMITQVGVVLNPLNPKIKI